VLLERFSLLAISEGLVVTPSTIPQAAPFRNSSRFAVSRKNFIFVSLQLNLSLPRRREAIGAPPPTTVQPG